MKMPLRFAELDLKKMFSLAGVVVGLFACLLGMHSALRIGQARALAKYSLERGSLTAASEAVRLSPDDPETYSARAISLLKRQEQNLAAEDLRRAITLRPRDYKLWGDLGNVLNRLDNNDAALSAMKEARALAPFYAGPHWDTAILLHKLGRQDEAFKEFRAATAIRPALFSRVIEAAWDVYPENCVAVQRAVDPQTPQERWAVAHFFIRKDKAIEALDLIRSANQMPYSERRQFVIEFLAAKEFASAHEVWAGAPRRNSTESTSGMIDDGGFESGRLSDEPGFGWIVNGNPAMNLSIDASAAGKGERSLLIKLQGGVDTSEEMISQLVPVEPNTRYHLILMARAQNLVSGGAPIVTITDVSQKDQQRVAQSSTLPLGTSGWENIGVDFSTSNSARAVRIGVQRQSCPVRPCPIFGSLWLDGFSLSTSKS